MLQAHIIFKNLEFSFPAHTSRGTLFEKPSFFIVLTEKEKTGWGECSVIPGLHPEYDNNYKTKLHQTIELINQGTQAENIELNDYPSIAFGLETALLDLQTQQNGLLFPSPFTEGTEGIAINGLIWMGKISEMKRRIKEKLDDGYKCLKLKVGALDFESELSLLKEIRKEFSPQVLEIRLDANGAYPPKEVLQKLKQFSTQHIHSIEQPIKAGQWDEMSWVCSHSPIPVALDEELIGIATPEKKRQLLQHIQPSYIILKPSLLGGLGQSEEWIHLASENNIDWWATSALESNIGLNAIAQWVFTKQPKMVQGLGTGQVFTNNIPSPLYLKGPELWFDAVKTKEFTLPL